MPFKNSISVFTKFTQKQKKKRGRKGHEWRGERGFGQIVIRHG
jgi:hypothetical protein